MKKEWTCNNQCKSNCCSEVFILINEKQKETFEKKGHMLLPHNKNMIAFLKLHKGIELSPINKMMWLFNVKKGVKTKILYNEHIEKFYLYVDDKCSKLLPNDRCKIYRARPLFCRIGKCPVFETDKKINWFAENGKLGDLNR